MQIHVLHDWGARQHKWPLIVGVAAGVAEIVGCWIIATIAGQATIPWIVPFFIVGPMVLLPASLIGFWNPKTAATMLLMAGTCAAGLCLFVIEGAHELWGREFGPGGWSMPLRTFLLMVPISPPMWILGIWLVVNSRKRPGGPSSG